MDSNYHQFIVQGREDGVTGFLRWVKITEFVPTSTGEEVLDVTSGDRGTQWGW